jgi:predicted pyridoxine 5'-phosphate oxidase superfamily flavin-nucleotide-binding protein
MDAAFHPGEQALQQREGVRERLAEIGPLVIRDHMPDQHRELFEKLPTLLLGALDVAGQPWATMLAGPPGFVSTPDARQLRVQLAPDAADPALRALRPGAWLGLLGLEAHTRRRNRMNGRLLGWDEAGLLVEVQQSFGNCPKYIHARRPEPRPAAVALPAVPLGPALDAAARALIEASDTLFIASASAAAPGPGLDGGSGQGVDVSHRGGEPGFVRLETATDGGLLLSLPDYPGNRFFNTLGNLSLHPRAGLLFVDHAGGGLLQLAADAEILWPEQAGPMLAARWPGAQRLLRLRLREGLWRPGVLPWRWGPAEPAPQFAALRAAG